MRFIWSLFINKDKVTIRKVIEKNSNYFMKKSGRTRYDADYLSICFILDDLGSSPRKKVGYKIVMDMLDNEYAEHYHDVFTYLAVQSGMIKLKQDEAQEFKERHQLF